MEEISTNHVSVEDLVFRIHEELSYSTERQLDKKMGKGREYTFLQRIYTNGQQA